MSPAMISVLPLPVAMWNSTWQGRFGPPGRWK